MTGNAASPGNNPVGLALVRNAMQGICDEMDILFARWAQGRALTSESRRACGIFDGEDGGMVVQSHDVWPAGFAEQHFAIKGFVKAVRDETCPRPNPGDLFVFNDPWTGAGTLVDIHLVAPLFHDGKVLLWLAISAHWPDFGGGSFGGVVPGAVDIFQEGMRLKPTRLFSAGKPVEEIETLILSNLRDGKKGKADLRAQTGAISRGLRLLTSLVDGYGAKAVSGVTQALRENARTLTLETFAEIPNGTWKSKARIDADQPGAEPQTVAITVDKRGHNILFNLARSSAPKPVCTNAPFSVTRAAIALALKHLLPHLPANAGFFDNILIEPPRRSFLAAEPPCAISGLAEVRRRVMEAVFFAMAQADADRFPAPPAGSWPWLAFTGTDPRDGDSYEICVPVPAGLGAHGSHDGTNCVMPLDEFCRFPSLERLEKRFPLLFERYRVRDRSAGTGKYRGGFGLELAFELRRGTAVLTVMADHGREPVQTAAPGTPGLPTEIRLGRSSSGITPPSRLRERSIPFLANQRLEILTSGGCGIGDPLERDLIPVRRDAQAFHYDLDEIDECYGVVIDEDGMKIDRLETEVRRARLGQIRDINASQAPAPVSRPSPIPVRRQPA